MTDATVFGGIQNLAEHRDDKAIDFGQRQCLVDLREEKALRIEPNQDRHSLRSKSQREHRTELAIGFSEYANVVAAIFEEVSEKWKARR
jgi:hypothetical protein